MPSDYRGQTPYIKDSLDYKIHINPYTGGISSKYFDTIDGIPAKKIVRFAISQLVYYQNTTISLSREVDNTVKFAGVCMNKNHLLPPIVETKTASAFERLFIIPNESYGTKEVVSRQPQKVSLFCNCSNIPRK